MGVRLSVIVPGYENPEWRWRRAVDSVLAALGPDDEVVCVDDGSASDTSFLDAWARRDGRMKVVRLESNCGSSVARNRGMDAARGEWLAFADSDDEVLPGVYGECLAALERTGADLAVFGVRVIWPDNGLYKDDLPSYSGTGDFSADDLRALRRERLLNYSVNKVYRRSFLAGRRIRFVDRAMPREDEVFAIDCVVAGARWCAVRKVGYVYYHGYGSSLGCYRRDMDESNRVGNDAWRRLWDHFGTPGEALGIVDAAAAKRAQWRNLWRPKSPCSLAARWRWLGENGVKGRHLAFLRMLVFSFLRRWCYVRPLRRWHVKRRFPEAREVRS